MKLLLLLCFMLAAMGIQTHVTELTQILKLTQKVNQYVTECIAEAGDGYEIKNNAITTVFSDEDDSSVEKVTHCFFHKAGILEPDGKLNIDAAMSILSLIGIEKDDAEDILIKCTSIAGFDAKDTAYAIFKCFEDGFKG